MSYVTIFSIFLKSKNVSLNQLNFKNNSPIFLFKNTVGMKT